VNHRKPWYRKSKDAWYVEIDGRQVQLAKGKDARRAAETKFHELMLQRAREEAAKADPRTILARAVCDLFLIAAEKTVEAGTFQWYKKYLQSFCDLHGPVRAADLRPLHLTAWLDAHPGWKASRRHAVIAIKRCFKWAEEEGVVDKSPFRGVKKPPVGRRDRILSADEKKEILETIRDKPFRQFVFALYETGCRPSEVARVRAEHFDAERGLWVFGKHKTRKKTEKPRVVYLTPAMVELTKELVAKYPEGPLFRGNRNHRGFTRNGIRCRFRRLREKLPQLKGVVSYTARHTYTTEALTAGVGILEVAELLGHASTEMVQQHYAHLDQKTQHMLEAAKRARASE
jgi:integrase